MYFPPASLVWFGLVYWFGFLVRPQLWKITCVTRASSDLTQSDARRFFVVVLLSVRARKQPRAPYRIPGQAPSDPISNNVAMAKRCLLSILIYSGLLGACLHHSSRYVSKVSDGGLLRADPAPKAPEHQLFFLDLSDMCKVCIALLPMLQLLPCASMRPAIDLPQHPALPSTTQMDWRGCKGQHALLPAC